MCARLLRNTQIPRLSCQRHRFISNHGQNIQNKAISIGVLQSQKDENVVQVTKHAQVNKMDRPPDVAFNKIDSSFENAREAFKSKSNSELIRSIFVFKLCAFKLLVKNNRKLLQLTRAVLGKTLFERFMKASFYGHFVAGEDEICIKPIVGRMQHFGIKSILDYSVEKDLSHQEAVDKERESCVSEAQPADLPNSDIDIWGQRSKWLPVSLSGDHGGPNVHFRYHQDFGDRRDLVDSARTYIYEDEQSCEENMNHFFKGIDAVSGATHGTGFSAIKLTALGRPQLLLQLSEVLSRMRRFYDILASGNWNEGTIRTKDFERHLKCYMLDSEERKHWLTVVDTTGDGVIDLLDWHNLLEENVKLAKLLRVPNLQTGQLEPLVTAWTDEEEHNMKSFLKRIDRVTKYAEEKDVRVMVDAEQTYFQVAINRLCMEMMRTYNKKKAIIFNTYQCYLKEAYSTATTDLLLAERENFHFGAKLVRGAYIEQERKRAVSLGYEDPINPSYEATTAMYEKVLEEMMKRIKTNELGKIAIMVASHNEDTIKYTLQKMDEYDIHSTDRVICFGQLFGMCDQISFTLGQAGYSVYKYVPYGPVEEVLPYLSRRAIENGALLHKLQKESRLLRTELRRRLKSFQFTYDPIKESPDPVQILGATPTNTSKI